MRSGGGPWTVATPHREVLCGNQGYGTVGDYVRSGDVVGQATCRDHLGPAAVSGAVRTSDARNL